MLEIEIGEPVETPQNPKDAFMITCEAGYGDGDGEETVKFGIFPNTPEYMPYLEEAIDFCERMKSYFPRGMTGYDTFVGIEGGDKWFNFEPEGGWDDADEVPEIYLDITACNEKEGWPGDPMNDYQGDCSFRSYQVHYFDADGVERKVKITR